MRHHISQKLALAGAVAGLFLCAAPLRAQTVVNGTFEAPSDGASGTDTTATGWTLNPAVGDNYTNPGQRCQFDSPTPNGGTWSLWLQTFVQFGSATQQVTGITPGTTYNLTSDLAFQEPGFDNITLANQATDPKSADTGNCFVYLGIQYRNASGQSVGAPKFKEVTAGTLNEVDDSSGATPWANYGVSLTAPAGASQAEIEIGWANGGVDGNTGGQSVFATDVALAPVAVPEPASLSLLSMGGVALLARRRAAKSA
jgi:hypothetical protein